MNEPIPRTDSTLTTSTGTLGDDRSQGPVFLRPNSFSESSDFVRKIASLIGVYSLALCEKKIEEQSSTYPFYRDGLLQCLRFHAEQPGANISDWEVLVAELRAGRSPSNGHNLGGDPLRDVVLAVAMLQNDSQAIAVFESDYFVYLKGIAYRVRSNFGNEPAEWWNEFLDFLAGYSHDNGKLKKYQGKCALRFWLRVVLWNFLQRRPLPGGTPEITDEIPTRKENDQLELSEGVDFFTALVKESLTEISDRERLLLSMIYIDNLLKKDIAAIFQIHPGQIGRWEEAALKKFREALFRRLENLPRNDLHEEIMGGIVSNPREFAEALVNALRKLQPEDSAV